MSYLFAEELDFLLWEWLALVQVLDLSIKV